MDIATKLSRSPQSTAGAGPREVPSLPADGGAPVPPLAQSHASAAAIPIPSIASIPSIPSISARREARQPRQSPAQRAVAAAAQWLLAHQAADGHWCGELEGDTILETEYVLLLHFLGRLDDPRVGKAARYVRRQQQQHGGWAIYPGGPAEVSASVKAYFVLKLAGDDPQAPHMVHARRTILALGGIEACNSFTKLYLSICGQYDWWRCPAVPPEMVLLPRWCYFNLTEISSWSRAIVVPLSVVWALRPVRPVPPHLGIDELRLRDGGSDGSDHRSADSAASGGATGSARAHSSAGATGSKSSAASTSSDDRDLPAAATHATLGGKSRVWRAFFTLLDRALRTGERLRLHPLRRRSLARAEQWILTRLEDSDGLGAIFPPIVNTIFALCCLGYDHDHPAVRSQIRELEKLEIEEDGALRLQPCFSPVWDTALALHALAEAGCGPADPAIRAARKWLIEHEIRRDGDWSVNAPGAAPGGWCFEYRNDFYPDCDDTAEVLTAFAGTTAAGGAAAIDETPAVRRGLAWMLAMQNRDGGWGAFDRACDKEVLTHVPFADHNALLDPSTADVTGRAADALLRLGLAPDSPPVARALAFLRGQQESDGTWYGRWGCNYIYGTWLALRALARAGQAGHAGHTDDIAAEPWCQRAVRWLLAHQNADGGWGETPLSYDDPSQKGIGPSTAAQTAWAMMALFGVGVVDHPAVERGVEFLLRNQREDGSWYDANWTATGFPRVFYLRYHLYAVYFPLMALAEYQRLRDAVRPQQNPYTYSLAVPLGTGATEGVGR